MKNNIVFSALPTALSLVICMSTVSAADLTKDDIKKAASTYPCIDRVNLPWFISIAKDAEIPSEYKRWAPYVIVGAASPTLMSGQELCVVTIIKSIKSSGFTQLTYMTGPPLNRTFDVNAEIKANDKGEQALSITFGNGADLVFTHKGDFLTGLSTTGQYAGPGTYYLFGQTPKPQAMADQPPPAKKE